MTAAGNLTGSYTHLNHIEVIIIIILSSSNLTPMLSRLRTIDTLRTRQYPFRGRSIIISNAKQ